MARTVLKPNIIVAINPRPPVMQPITVPTWAALFSPPEPPLDEITVDQCVDEVEDAAAVSVGIELLEFSVVFSKLSVGPRTSNHQ
jgi:hypothetical protein